MTLPKTLTLILADDHGVIREGVAAHCATLPELTILAQCSDGDEAARAILELRPDFAIIDLNMPKMTGLEVIRAVRAAGSTTRLIVLSTDRNRPMIQELFRSGADGYVLKDGPIRHILDAIHYIADGGKYTTPLLGAEPAGPSPPAADPVATLSRREQQVFSFLVDGMRPRDIARTLELSPKTVDTYRASIMRKLNVEGIAGLVRYAIQRNLPVKRSS
jgi:DNA-binding NarL/FixJ family response regulator